MESSTTTFVFCDWLGNICSSVFNPDSVILHSDEGLALNSFDFSTLNGVFPKKYPSYFLVGNRFYSVPWKKKNTINFPFIYSIDKELDQNYSKTISKKYQEDYKENIYSGKISFHLLNDLKPIFYKNCLNSGVVSQFFSFMFQYLYDMGINIESYGIVNDSGLYYIKYSKYYDITSFSDAILLTRIVASYCAGILGICCTFAPKLFSDKEGSSLEIEINFKKDFIKTENINNFFKKINNFLCFSNTTASSFKRYYDSNFGKDLGSSLSIKNSFIICYNNDKFTFKYCDAICNPELVISSILYSLFNTSKLIDLDLKNLIKLDHEFYMRGFHVFFQEDVENIDMFEFVHNFHAEQIRKFYSFVSKEEMLELVNNY